MIDYLIFGLILFLLDIPFLKYIKNKYINASVNINNSINVIYVILAYIAMTISWKIINENENPIQTATLIGFIIYAVYAFTILAIIPNYTLQLGITEILWGTILFSIATFLTNKIKKM